VAIAAKGTGPKFAIAGVAGYVAPRHLEAIHAIGGTVAVAYDPHDSVGILDKRFPEATFTTDPNVFWRTLLGRVDYVVCCAPNNHHAYYALEASRNGIKSIIEKPICIDDADYKKMANLSQHGSPPIFPVLQLRLHPEIVKLRDRIGNTSGHRVSLRYVSRRGPWYMESWKGNQSRSGGLAMNIGIHLFDMLLWIFGKPLAIKTTTAGPTRMAGTLHLERADVDWLLSIDNKDVPKDGPAERSMVVDGDPVVFTGGFEDLHTAVYRRIVAGDWYTAEDAGPALDLVHAINGTGVGR